MASKKYLSLEEAADLLGLTPERLIRVREKGDVRGFADRGTWKFRRDDIEEFQRRHQADSDPAVPLLSNPKKDVAMAYGVVTAGRQLPSRWTYIIGGDGKILHIDRSVNPSTAGEDLVAHLTELNVAMK